MYVLQASSTLRGLEAAGEAALGALRSLTGRI
jgi:hypothetical protein